MNDVYIVVLEERHSGVSVFAFSSKDAANSYAQELAEDYCSDLDDIEEEVTASGLYAAGWNNEGDYVSVVAKEIE